MKEDEDENEVFIFLATSQLRHLQDVNKNKSNRSPPDALLFSVPWHSYSRMPGIRHRPRSNALALPLKCSQYSQQGVGSLIVFILHASLPLWCQWNSGILYGRRRRRRCAGRQWLCHERRRHRTTWTTAASCWVCWTKPLSF